MATGHEDGLYFDSPPMPVPNADEILSVFCAYTPASLGAERENGRRYGVLMTSWDDPAACSRALYALFEPLHLVTYFTPEARAAYEEAGLRGYWRGYFAGRAAPLGPVGPEPVIAAFYGFAPSMVSRAMPDVWSRATPQATLAARAAGARAALTRLLGSAPHSAEIVEAAQLLHEAATSIDFLGRPLGAALAALPWPDPAEPLDVLWHAATILREQRGDGHVAALLVEGLDGCESLVWRASVDTDRSILQPNRGWTDEQWDAAAARLTARGWLGADGRPTEPAVAARDRIEHTTDRLAAGPWRALGPDRTARLATLLEPLAKAALTVVPQPNPIGKIGG
jgi:hypothetical protein